MGLINWNLLNVTIQTANIGGFFGGGKRFSQHKKIQAPGAHRSSTPSLAKWPKSQ